MKTLTLYHNSRCSKSRAVLEILEKSGLPFKIVHYLETPPTESELDVLLQVLKLEPSELVRTGEDEYEALGLEKTPPKTREAWIKILTQNPILIERPIVSNGERALIGRPPERVNELLS